MRNWGKLLGRMLIEDASFLNVGDKGRDLEIGIEIR